MRIKPPFSYFGGKQLHVTRLLPYVPPHRFYAEVFGGAASLLFAKAPSEFEVYNDINSDLVNFFRVVRDPRKFKRLLKKLWLTPYSREEFTYCKENFATCKDPVERAYMWYVVQVMSFGGGGRKNPSFGFVVKSITRGMPRSCASYLSCLESFPYIHSRIMKVQIENLDFRRLFEIYISEWDYADSFAYLDPPYFPSARKEKKYPYEMTEEDHAELVELLLKYSKNCKFMLSGYPNPVYERLEKEGWQKISWNIVCNAIGRIKGLKGKSLDKEEYRRQETIWVNYEISKDRTLFGGEQCW